MAETASGGGARIDEIYFLGISRVTMVANVPLGDSPPTVTPARRNACEVPAIVTRSQPKLECKSIKFHKKKQL
jgi:hypothetical protein